MSAEQKPWDRLQSLFEQAIQVPEEDRDEFLKQACGDNSRLHGELQSLVKSYHASETELETSPVASILDVVPSVKLPHDAIPGYTIQHELHRGGQGVVYKAFQHNTKRIVALKVMLEGPFADPKSKRRFERDIELVGSLRHSGIVPIFESGVTRGQCFYVMDYIQGAQLDVHAQDKSLSLEEILSLFVKVCDAVDYAHQRGIIHRDLKPSNVIVDDAGQPHVVDFGLAKAGGAALEKDESVLVSVTGQVMGTLSYMSPEQAAGQSDQVDMRSDVYSLGVVLYELLSGQLPYDLGSSMAENLHTSQHAPLRRLDPHIHRVDDEVRTIVLKSLSKEKTRRYPTAGALKEDLARYLRGEPIEAKRDSALYYAEMRLAGQALAEPGGVGQVRELTQQWHPQQVGIDLRGWEWFYLDSLGRREQTIMTDGKTLPVWSLDWSPDATRIVASSNDRRIRIWDATSATQIAEIESDAFRLLRRLEPRWFTVGFNRFGSIDPRLGHRYCRPDKNVARRLVPTLH